MSAAVGAYAPAVDAAANRFVTTRRAKQVGAEYDDLRQEGLLAVWQALAKGVKPSKDIIEARMSGWIRLLAYQTGQHLPECELDPETGEPVGDCPQHVPYEALLPLDDFRFAQRAA